MSGETGVLCPHAATDAKSSSSVLAGSSCAVASNRFFISVCPCCCFPRCDDSRHEDGEPRLCLFVMEVQSSVKDGQLQESEMTDSAGDGDLPVSDDFTSCPRDFSNWWWTFESLCSTRSALLCANFRHYQNAFCTDSGWSSSAWFGA